MARYKHILCCLDFSPRSEEAFETALELSRQNQAKLCLLHVVVPKTPLLPGEPPRKKLGLKDEIVPRLKEYIKENYLSRAGSVDCEFHLRRGHPSVEILAHLKEHPADLVVMGSEGLSGMGLVILGSVAEQVLRGASCSCLICR